MAEIKIKLSDTEWMEIIDKTRDGLPVCCANISALRDTIIGIAREGGDVNVFDKLDLEKHITWVQEGHDLPLLILKICEQVGIDPTGLADRLKKAKEKS